ncbi:MAG: type I-C CRISPR-associated endonuclease Cas1 [Desulfobacteraceae bacterium]|nr:MAG: type I-C CRISPR-associated endonuclease Cas1 [Desulfobacteraceae bacterium]
MKKLLNTLFVTTQGSYLSKDGETVAVKVEKEIKVRIPIHTLSGIVCFGNVSMSPFLMGFCAEKDVSVSFLTEYGRFLARVTGPVSGNVLVRREQYRRADCEQFSSAIASSIISAKISNSRTVLKRFLRDHAGKNNSEAIDTAIQRLENALKETQNASSLNILRGIEGNAASAYFSAFNHLIVIRKNDFEFNERNRRPPLDPVNCLLSFLYTLLMHDVRSAIECVGLDPAVGFLHRDRPGRPGLALDLMEEFRSFMADRLTLSLINLGQVTQKDFFKKDNGAVYMTDEGRKTVLMAYQKKKQDEIFHPFIEEKILLGQLFYIQALLMNRYMRNDLDGYPSFFWR